MRPYATAFSGWWIARQAITKPIERYLSPKLLVVKSTDRLQAALDTQGHIALQTLYLLHLHTKETSEAPIRPALPVAPDRVADAGASFLNSSGDVSAMRRLSPEERTTSGQAGRKEEDDLYFFLALLNSRLLRKYVYLLHTAYKWVQPQIEQHVLARLPIPIATPAEKQQIIERAKLLVGADKSAVGTINRPLRLLSIDPPSADACSEPGPVVEWNEPMQSMYEEQERAICALYDAALL